MIPPFDTVVKSPPSGVEIKAQTLAPIASSRPNGSAATTGPTVRRAQAARARAGVNAAAKTRCRAQDAVSTRNALRVGLGMGSSHDSGRSARSSVSTSELDQLGHLGR